MTVWFIVIVGGFLSGLVGRAVAPSKRGRRLAVLAALMFGCSVVLQIPVVIDLIQGRSAPFGWDALAWLAELQGVLVLAACLTTGAGWVLASFIKAVFENQPE